MSPVFLPRDVPLLQNPGICSAFRSTEHKNPKNCNTSRCTEHKNPGNCSTSGCTERTNPGNCSTFRCTESIGLFMLQGYIFKILGQHTLTEENFRGIKICNGHVKHCIGYIEMAEASFSAYVFGLLQGKNSIF